MRPLCSGINKSGTNRILLNVIPFLRVAFLVAQNVIKKSWLPQWSISRRANCHGHCSFQAIHPFNKVEVIIPSHEEMQMIGHDDVTANTNAKFFGASTRVLLECTM
jgi:hypothetical protein